MTARYALYSRRDLERCRHSCSDGIVLYAYDKRMCYFDAVIEEF